MAPSNPSRERLDPLGPILRLGQRNLRIGAVLGIVGALTMHAGAATKAARSFHDLRSFATRIVGEVKAKLGSEIDLDTSRPPPPPPPPPPEPEPEPPKEEPPPRAARESEPPPPPPAPAEAGKVLTADPDPDAPVDLTDQGFVTGNADRYAGGVTSPKGTAKTAVYDTKAVVGGVPGGTGTAPVPPPPPARDLSRPPVPIGRSADCPFPAEADLEGLNHARVSVIATVNPDGTAKSVSILQDPGFGFGQAARRCAMRMPYSPGLDVNGKPVTKTTSAFTFSFRR